MDNTSRIHVLRGFGMRTAAIAAATGIDHSEVKANGSTVTAPAANTGATGGTTGTTGGSGSTGTPSGAVGGVGGPAGTTTDNGDGTITRNPVRH